MPKTTIQTRLNLTSHEDKVLGEISSFYSSIERTIYSFVRDGGTKKQVRDWLKECYSLTHRETDSILLQLQGKINSRDTWHQKQVEEFSERIKSTEKWIKTKTAKREKLIKEKPKAIKRRKRGKVRKGDDAVLNTNKNGQPESERLASIIYQKQRRLDILKNRLSKLEAQSHGKMIFGSRKLFYAQFNLEKNGYTSHEEWREDWRAARDSQFMMVGQADHAERNLLCQYKSDQSLRIRVPNLLHATCGQWLTLSNIKFPNGQHHVDNALYQEPAPLTYRFVQKKKGWYLFCTVDVPELPRITSKSNGAMGVDQNPSSLGWAICDYEGNLKAKGRIPLNLQDLSTNQTKAVLGNAVKEIVDIAAQYEVPIVIENLNFDKKKAAMREASTKYARMLSNFAYSQFDALLTSRCARMGIQLNHQDPAYSSLIGIVKFMSMYGLSSDTAAGLVLARRFLRRSERLKCRRQKLPVKVAGKQKRRHSRPRPRNARKPPVDGIRHVWTLWGRLSRRAKKVSRHEWYSPRPNRAPEVTLTNDDRLCKPEGLANCVFGRWAASILECASDQSLPEVDAGETPAGDAAATPAWVAPTQLGLFRFS